MISLTLFTNVLVNSQRYSSILRWLTVLDLCIKETVSRDFWSLLFVLWFTSQCQFELGLEFVEIQMRIGQWFCAVAKAPNQILRCGPEHITCVTEHLNKQNLPDAKFIVLLISVWTYRILILLHTDHNGYQTYRITTYWILNSSDIKQDGYRTYLVLDPLICLWNEKFQTF
jgi:hypothetical protein